MEYICPQCNEIKNCNYICNKCGGTMEDKGRVQEYYGPYSADAPIEDNGSSCTHVFLCNKCNLMERNNIKKVII